MIIEKPISEQEITLLLKEVRAANINSLAVLFLHSYMYPFCMFFNNLYEFFSFPDHEKLVEKIARSQGFENISISSGVIPMIKAVPRGFTSKFTF